MLERLLKRKLPVSIDRSLHLKVTLGIILPMILMLGVFTLIEYNHHRTTQMNNLSNLASYNGELIKDALFHSMSVSDFTDIQRTLDKIGENKNFRLVYLLDTSGKVVFAPGGEGLGVQLSNLNPTCQPCHKLPPNERPSGVVVTNADGQRVFRSMHPIENSPECSACHDPQQRLIGLLLTDIDVAPFEAAFTADMRENLLWGGATVLLSAVMANLVFGRLVTRRLERVDNALAGFGSGKRDLRLEQGSQDEIGRLEADFNAMGQHIQAEEAENQALSADLRHRAAQQQELLRQLITAQEDERKRVARELHDELGQSLTGLALQAEVIEQFIHADPQRALQQLQLTRGLIDITTQQMYDLILALRPSVLDDLGLAVALRSLAERVLEGSGITFKLETYNLTGRLPASIETTLYRVFQEAISNVVRHSGASQLVITLAQRDGLFAGEIIDNGHGFDPQEINQDGDCPRGLGLLGMQERLAQCGGGMQIISRKGEGTRILMHVPLEEMDHE